MPATSTKGSIQTRPSRCGTHGLVQGTRKMPRLVFPFIVTGAMRLIAMTRPYRCPNCGSNTAKA
jgi:DNA-directed RNA polymerase subunit RPC12/RpoP